jgi:hypothetical protein
VTKYVVQYRPRTSRRSEKDPWKDAQEFDLLDDAVTVKDNAIKFEMKGTKDWRIQPR